MLNIDGLKIFHWRKELYDFFFFFLAVQLKEKLSGLTVLCTSMIIRMSVLWIGCLPLMQLIPAERTTVWRTFLYSTCSPTMLVAQCYIVHSTVQVQLLAPS